MTFSERVAALAANETASITGAEAPNMFSTSRVLAGAGAIAAIGAASSGVAPTGTGWWDTVLAAAFAIAFVVAAARSGRVAILVAAGIAAVFVGFSLWLIVAAMGFGCGMATEVFPGHRRELQAASGAFTVVALLHLKSIGFFGLPSLLAGIGLLVVLASGYRLSSEVTRQLLRFVTMVTALAVGFLLVLAGYFAVSIRSTANSGVQAARLGLAAARAGDTQELTRQLERAQAQLGRANEQINSPLLKPLLLLPVAAQNLRSLATATDQGVVIANEASTTAQEANLDELQLRQGQFDLALLASMAPRLETTVQQLEQAVRLIEADNSPWLLPPVTSQLDSLVAEVTEVLPEARVAADAARVMPAMLGANGERRYLMLFGQPGESREFGGFVGGYALIGIDDGSLALIRAGSINDLVDLARTSELDDPDSYPTEFVNADPAFFPQNLTSTPNLEVIARAVREIFPALEGAPVDGVIYADPFALAAMTAFTGPVAVQGIEEPLDQDGLIDFMFEGQYEAFEDREERFSAIGALAVAVASEFEDADLPGPEQLGHVLGPAARAGRLQIITYDQAENNFLSSVKLQRNFAAPAEADADAFAVVHTNGTASKLDLYMHRHIRYDLTVDQDRNLSARVDVELRSEIADDIPPLTLGETDGTNQVLLTLYSRHELTALTVDGEQHDYVVQREFGFFRYALFKIPVPPNVAVAVSFELKGLAPEGPYRVGLWEQPLVNNDLVEVTYREPGAEPVHAEQEMFETWLFDPLVVFETN